MSLLSRAKKILKGKEDQTAAKKSDAAATVAPRKVSQGETTGLRTIPQSELAARIGLTPLLTEKSFEAQAVGSSAAFQVTMSATKQEIARAVKEQYGTNVLDVRTSRVRGKLRRRGTTYGTTSAWKKAYVKVADIQKLQVNP